MSLYIIFDELARSLDVWSASNQLCVVFLAWDDLYEAHTFHFNADLMKIMVSFGVVQNLRIFFFPSNEILS
jgi:hypothetical protein